MLSTVNRSTVRFGTICALTAGVGASSMAISKMPLEKPIQRIKSAYAHVSLGLATTGLAATVMYQNGFTNLLIRATPGTFFVGSMLVMVPTLLGIMFTDYHQNPVQKYLLWHGFNIFMASSLSMVGFFGGPIIGQAALATAGIVGGLSLVAFKSESDTFETFEGPLGIGLGGIVACGVANLIWPMPILHNVLLYGGLIVFGGLTLTDTQKLRRQAESNALFDPINESLGIYLNTLNIFIRMVEILDKLNRSGKKRR